MRNHSSISVDFGNGRKTWTRSLHPHSYLVTLKVLSLHIQLFSITVRLMPGSLAPDIFQNKFIFIGLNSEICFRMSQNSNKTIPTSYTTVTNSVVKANTAGPCTQFVAQTSIYITNFVLISADKKLLFSIHIRGGRRMISINRQISSVSYVTLHQNYLRRCYNKILFCFTSQTLDSLLLMCELLCC